MAWSLKQRTVAGSERVATSGPSAEAALACEARSLGVPEIQKSSTTCTYNTHIYIYVLYIYIYTYAYACMFIQDSMLAYNASRVPLGAGAVKAIAQMDMKKRSVTHVDDQCQLVAWQPPHEQNT